jgi:Spy/CpxP family protein refolding chaperone
MILVDGEAVIRIHTNNLFFNPQKKSMKKIMLSAVIISASVCAAYAQDQKTTPQADQKTTPPQVVKEVDQKSYQAKQQQDWENLLKAELKLTDEQSTKIAAINKDFSEKKEAILKDATLSDDAKKEKKEALKKDKQAKIAEVLTPEQQTKYQQLMETKMKETQAPKQ